MIWAGRAERRAKTKKNGKLARFSTFFFGWKCSFALPHYSITFFLLTKSCGCQRKSFRYWTKENFDTCPRSEGFIITELCHFLWDQFMLTQHKVRLRIVKKWMFKMLVSTKNVISQWICVLQTWDRCQNFPWFDT